MKEYPCQQLLGGTGAAIYSNEDGLCDHPECRPPLDDHTLNACLARVVGRIVKEVLVESDEPTVTKCWAEFGDDGELIDIWCPVADADQTEEVEAWLREKFGEILYIEMACHWSLVQHEWSWRATVKVGCKEFIKIDHDKKRAFALAVYQMEQAQQEST